MTGSGQSDSVCWQACLEHRDFEAGESMGPTSRTGGLNCCVCDRMDRQSALHGVPLQKGLVVPTGSLLGVSPQSIHQKSSSGSKGAASGREHLYWSVVETAGLLATGWIKAMRYFWTDCMVGFKEVYGRNGCALLFFQVSAGNPAFLWSLDWLAI